MKNYLISRGRFVVENATIEANSEEEALEKAENDFDIYWKHCPDDEKWAHQIEDEWPVKGAQTL